MSRLSVLVDRYGEAIEADLADRGFDLAQLWGERRFRFILNIVDHLPRNSAYVQAMSDDEEWAEQVLAQPREEKSAPSVRMADWSAELEMLTNLYDAVRELIRVSAMAAGAKARKVKPAPRPRTALERVRARQRDSQHTRLVAHMLPHKAQQVMPPS